MKVTTKVEFTEEEIAALKCLDKVRAAMFAANGAGEGDFRAFATQGMSSEPTDDNTEGVYGYLNRAFMRGLELFADVTHLEVPGDSILVNGSVPDLIADRVIDNGESVTWNVTQMIQNGDLR